MKPTFISATLAAAMTFTAMTSTPVQADEEDVAKALLALALIAGVAHALNDDDPAPTPTPAATTFSTGPLDIPQTWTADLDHGHVGGAGADIWFQAETAHLIYITPSNGAGIAVGDRSNRGRHGCAAASFTSARVSLSDIPVGSYVCAKTNEGRISQFRVNGISAHSPRNLQLGYTTWN